MHLPLESLADNSCFHCTKILFHAMENKVSYQTKGGARRDSFPKTGTK